MEKQPNRLLDQLSNLLVPRHSPSAPETVTNERILRELIHCFDTSLTRESVGTSLLFNAHYIILLHPDTYKERMAAFPVIVSEAVNEFTTRLTARKSPQTSIPPVSSHWYFKFGPGTEFNGKPIGLSDVEVIGSLTGLSLAGPNPAETPSVSRVKVTRKVKNTNVYDQLDVNPALFGHIDFREAGAFAIRMDALPMAHEPRPITRPAPPVVPVEPPLPPSALARIDCYLADTNTETTYWMQDQEVVVARQEPDNQTFPNYLRLDSPYVSNPHARIRHNEAAQTFEIASFSRHETRVNERVVARSEPASPQWTALPPKAQILLNGIVTLVFQPNA